MKRVDRSVPRESQEKARHAADAKDSVNDRDKIGLVWQEAFAK